MYTPLETTSSLQPIPKIKIDIIIIEIQTITKRGEEIVRKKNALLKLKSILFSTSRKTSMHLRIHINKL